MYMYFNCYDINFNLQVVVRALHIHVHVDQVGLVSAVSMLTVLVPLTVVIMVPVMTVLTLQFAGKDSYFTVQVKTMTEYMFCNLLYVSFFL